MTDMICPQGALFTGQSSGWKAFPIQWGSTDKGVQEAAKTLWGLGSVQDPRGKVMMARLRAAGGTFR